MQGTLSALDARDAREATRCNSDGARLAADLGWRLVDLEINPLIVRESGHGAIAVDLRGTLAADKEPQP